MRNRKIKVSCAINSIRYYDSRTQSHYPEGAVTETGGLRGNVRATAQCASGMIGGSQSTAVQALIVIVFQLEDWCRAQLIDPKSQQPAVAYTTRFRSGSNLT